jgi:hypothetical protein
MYYENNLSSSLRNRIIVPVLGPLSIEDLQAKGEKQTL